MKKLTQSQFKINEQLTLKVLQLEHAEELFSLVDSNRTYLKQWLGWLDYNTSIDSSHEFIRKSMCDYMQGTDFCFGIFYSDNSYADESYLGSTDYKNRHADKLIGTISLMKALGSLNLGYWLSEDMQGKGIITTCTDFVTKLALNEIDAHRVIIRCALENAKSRAIPERLGYTEEGIAREMESLNGKRIDLVVYSFIKSDLNKKNNDE